MSTTIGRADPPLRKEVMEYAKKQDKFLQNRVMILSGLASMGKIARRSSKIEKPQNLNFSPCSALNTHMLPGADPSNSLSLTCFSSVFGTFAFDQGTLLHIWTVQQDEFDKEFETFPTSKAVMW